MNSEGTRIDILVDKKQPSTMTFEDSDGHPFLSFDPDAGWILKTPHYHPFALQVNEFDAMAEALREAHEVLAKPLTDSGLVTCERIRLRCDWGKPGGTSYFLDANLESNGTLTIYGQELGPTVGRDGEYEYWYGIEAAHIPALLIALGGTPDQDVLTFLQQNWSGDAAQGLETAIRSSGVEYRFFNYF